MSQSIARRKMCRGYPRPDAGTVIGGWAGFCVTKAIRINGERHAQFMSIQQPCLRLREYGGPTLIRDALLVPCLRREGGWCFDKSETHKCNSELARLSNTRKAHLQSSDKYVLFSTCFDSWKRLITLPPLNRGVPEPTRNRVQGKSVSWSPCLHERGRGHAYAISLAPIHFGCGRTLLISLGLHPPLQHRDLRYKRLLS